MSLFFFSSASARYRDGSGDDAYAAPNGGGEWKLVSRVSFVVVVLTGVCVSSPVSGRRFCSASGLIRVEGFSSSFVVAFASDGSSPPRTTVRRGGERQSSGACDSQSSGVPGGGGVGARGDDLAGDGDRGIGSSATDARSARVASAEVASGSGSASRASSSSSRLARYARRAPYASAAPALCVVRCDGGEDV